MNSLSNKEEKENKIPKIIVSGKIGSIFKTNPTISDPFFFIRSNININEKDKNVKIKKIKEILEKDKDKLFIVNCDNKNE